MNLKLIFTLVILILGMAAFSQEAIDVSDQIIRIGGLKEEDLYFGFAEGDKIIFNFTEANNKELKKIGIIEYPDNIRFSDFKTSKVENKTIYVSKQSVYRFHFKNSSLTGRICKIKIQRIPASEATKNFNSTVSWETRQITDNYPSMKDTIIGYDTTYTKITKRELVKTELSEDLLMDKTERINSIRNFKNKNFKTISVNLPQNENTGYKTKTLIAWAYWIGVGKEASEAWAKNVNTLKNLVSGAATLLGAGPLASLAIGTVVNLITPTMGEDVEYCFLPDSSNALLFMEQKPYRQFDKGKGVAAYGKNQDIKQGIFYIGLLNDNQILGINVNVKIAVVWESKYYEDKVYEEMHVTPRYKKKTYKEPVIKTVKIPVTSQ